MHRHPCSAAVLLALLGVACAVDRSGAGEQATGATAGSRPAVNVESAGSRGTGASGASVDLSGGSAGVFGVATDNGGGGSGSGNQDHQGGAGGDGDSGATEPVESGTVVVDVGVAIEAGDASDASSVPTCATHAGGQTFTPNGAVSAHCYWTHSAKSDWQTAVDACMVEGGHLAALGSAAESNFVVKLIANFGTGTTERLWLGGTDKKTSTDDSGGGPYQWITGEPFTYAPWAQNNPDGACDDTCNGSPCKCQHRVCIDRGGVFWDRYEGELYYSVCESEP